MKTAKKLSIWFFVLVFGAGLIGNVPVIPAHAITVSPSSIVLLPGQSKRLKVKSASGTVTYKSSNTRVAKVDARGKITAKKKGKATITISSSNGKKSCKVKVEQIKLNQTSMDLTLDDEELSYDFITVKGCSHTPTYRSTDEEVVSVDEAGNVEAEGEGTATIIVRVHGKTLKCKVRVEEVSVDDEESFSDDEEEEEDEDEDYYGY